MMFAGTYSSAYYKVLHRYVHNRYRIQRGIIQIQNWLHQPVLPTLLHVKRVVSMLFHFPFSLINYLQLKKLSKANDSN
jgi:anaerobic magnesium-protoporphyrin IX monomethyl ester cyclase